MVTKSLVAVITDLASWHVLKVGVGEPPSLLDVTHSTSLSTPGDIDETVHCLSSIVIEEISEPFLMKVKDLTFGLGRERTPFSFTISFDHIV